MATTTKAAHFVIRATDERDGESGAALYWNNADGWVSRDDADTFETTNYRLPVGGSWEAVYLCWCGDTITDADRWGDMHECCYIG